MEKEGSIFLVHPKAAKPDSFRTVLARSKRLLRGPRAGDLGKTPCHPQGVLIGWRLPPLETCYPVVIKHGVPEKKKQNM
jgi:hypothetical protein